MGENHIFSYWKSHRIQYENHEFLLNKILKILKIYTSYWTFKSARSPLVQFRPVERPPETRRHSFNNIMIKIWPKNPSIFNLHFTVDKNRVNNNFLIPSFHRIMIFLKESLLAENLLLNPKDLHLNQLTNEFEFECSKPDNCERLLGFQQSTKRSKDN